MAPDASTSPVDWSRPIEAVHEDGWVVAVELAFGPDSDDVYKITTPLEPSHGQAQYFKTDGTQEWKLSDRLGGGRPWHIRNVQPTTPELDPALWDRMVALVRKCHALTDYDHPLPGAPFIGKAVTEDEQWLADEARAIVADLPKPVDSDLIEARRIAACDGFYEGTRETVERGEHDEAWPVRIALAAIKRGRELAGDKA